MNNKNTSHANMSDREMRLLEKYIDGEVSSKRELKRIDRLRSEIANIAQEESKLRSSRQVFRNWAEMKSANTYGVKRKLDIWPYIEDEVIQIAMRRDGKSSFFVTAVSFLRESVPSRPMVLGLSACMALLVVYLGSGNAASDESITGNGRMIAAKKTVSEEALENKKEQQDSSRSKIVNDELLIPVSNSHLNFGTFRQHRNSVNDRIILGNPNRATRNSQFRIMETNNRASAPVVLLDFNRHSE